MVNVIIFTKDRPAQLDLLLRSIRRFVDGAYKLNVIIGSSFNIAWQRESQYNLHSKVDFFQQYGDDFKQCLLYSIDYSKYTMFLTDDCVFVRDVDLHYVQLPKTYACLSLRLGANISYDYPLGKQINAPDGIFAKHGGISGWIEDLSTKEWCWKNQDGYWGYPMSLDGHIFRTSDIAPLLERLQYDSPNSLETVLSRNPIDKPFMQAYELPSIINLAMNRVQNTHPNRCGNVSAEYLNEQYINGKRIALDPIVEMAKTANSCHVEYQPTFEDR